MALAGPRWWAGGAGPGGGRSQGSTGRVLWVEDERRLADLLARGLREAGHTVDVRHSGSDGLIAAVGHAYDCVVLDWMLPGLDGTAVCRTLRQRGRTTP